MIRQEWLEIRRLDDEGLTKRAIGRRLGIHRRKVRQALKSEHPPKRISRQRASMIDPYRGFILAKLDQYPELMATRIYRILQERGFTGSYSLVKQTVAELRVRTKPVHQELHFEPGECAQVDWGEWKFLTVKGGKRRLSFFSMTLCQSRLQYVEFFHGETIEFWLMAHRNAFEFFGGVPETVMVDCCKTAIIKPRKGDKPAVVNVNYEDFANYYGFKVVACAPRQPQQKGRVERNIRYIKESFLADREPSVLDAINPAAWDWRDNVANIRVHGTTKRRPIDLFNEAEKVALRPLPGTPHACTAIVGCTANSCCRVIADTNRYSVPPSHASRRLTMHRYVDRIVILDTDGSHVTSHARCFDRNQPKVDLDHEAAIKRLTRRARDNKQITCFLSLGGSTRDYFDGLKEKRVHYLTHVRKINDLVEIHGRQAVLRALADANEHRAYSADSIINLLNARQRFNDTTDQPALHVARNADLLDLKIDQTDLTKYNQETDND